MIPTPISTYGLTHLNLEVRDPDVSLRFYTRLFGVQETYRDAKSIQVSGPGPHDVIAFVKSDQAGNTGGITHFGFRLREPADMATALESAIAVGATIIRQGEFGPGLPYLYLLDPDGYEIEIWYE